MAFIFPADKATFTAANGITYAWKDDHWVVQKFKGDHEVYVADFPPSDPEEGKLWYDSSDDVIELFIYVQDKWVSATPNSEYALETRIAQNEQGIRDLWSDQTRQDFEVAAIETRVDALEGVVGEFQYKIQTANPTPRNGELAFLKGDMSTTTRWGDATNIAVNPTSLSGDIWATDEIVTGDVLRFHLKGDITMEVSAFEAKVVQNNNNLFSIDHVVKEVGTIMDGAEYEVFHLSSFDPSGLATMNYVDAQDSNLKDYTDGQIADLQSQIDGVEGEYLTKEGQQDLDSAAWKIRQPNSDGNFRSFINIYDGEMNLYNVVTPSGSSNEKWAANKEYADKKVAKTGGTMTGDLNLDGADRAINIENGNRFRLKAKDADGAGRTFVDIQTADHDGPEAQDAGYRIRIYHLADPTSEYHAANRKYVDEQVASVGGSGVPVGSIMIWMNSTAPDGWFKLQGGSFDVNQYPQLHAYLQGTSGYSSGTLPSWGGHYPGEYGDHLTGSLGSKQEYKTAKPSGGAPKSSNNIPDGTTRTFNGVGNTNAYSNGASRVTIDSGWDSVTRPPTVIVHYIIKHD